MGNARHHTLIFKCPEGEGILRDVGDYFRRHDCVTREASHFGDPEQGRFFFRAQLAPRRGDPEIRSMRADFQAIAEAHAMDWQLYGAGYRPRLLVLVSQYGHCLDDLLFRYRNGFLEADIVAVASNHEDFRDLVEWHGLAFHHLPVQGVGKERQEARLAELADTHQTDYIILARYMQILSDDFCARYSGRIINVHHALLPAFKGANPYRRAYERGVKIIGATAHFATAELDEGPIIDQDVARVHHGYDEDDLVAVGRDTERTVLGRAVSLAVEHRVLLNNAGTVVFS